MTPATRQQTLVVYKKPLPPFLIPSGSQSAKMYNSIALPSRDKHSPTIPNSLSPTVIGSAS